MILLVMGLKKANSTHACVWCKVDKPNRYMRDKSKKITKVFCRWDTDVNDSEYLVTRKRTLQSILDDHQRKEYCCQNPPLLNIETDHIIPDELHILLRITDVLLKNLISTAVAEDKKSKRLQWKLMEGPMLNAVISNIRRCGIPFSVWENNEEPCMPVWV